MYLCFCVVFMCVINSAFVYGSSILRGFIFGTPPPDNTACITPCSAGYCVNGGTCHVNISTCNYWCECLEDFSGKRCDELQPDVTSAYTVTVENATVSDSSSHEQTTTNERKSSTSFSSPQTTTTTKLHETSLTSDYPSYHACSLLYSLRPLTERECIPNNLFVCVYGKCGVGGNERYTNPNCTCDVGSTDMLCSQKCCLDCSGHGRCQKDSTDAEWCRCDIGYKGELCETVDLYNEGSLHNTTNILTTTTNDNTDEWYYGLIGTVSVVLLILTAMVIVLPYVMWRHRVTLIMKIVHYLQPYEDDDERKWDAFVSYRSSDQDQDFVQRILFPKIETELGFSLCLHQRDFVPGETIANNIINAVNNSRRTILILSPRYVESDFARMECQVAQHEMLKRKHRIIPIMLEDISTVKHVMDPTLKHILKSVTYIEYPELTNKKRMEKFWKRIVLSLPKKRTNYKYRSLHGSLNSGEDVETQHLNECNIISSSNCDVVSNLNVTSRSNSDVVSNLNVTSRSNSDVVSNLNVTSRSNSDVVSNLNVISSSNCDVVSDLNGTISSNNDVVSDLTVISSSNCDVVSDLNGTISSNSDVVSDLTVISSSNCDVVSDLNIISSSKSDVVSDLNVVSSSNCDVVSDSNVVSSSNSDILSNSNVVSSDVVKDLNVISSSNSDVVSDFNIICGSNSDTIETHGVNDLNITINSSSDAVATHHEHDCNVIGRNTEYMQVLHKGHEAGANVLNDFNITDNTNAQNQHLSIQNIQLNVLNDTMIHN